MVHSQSTKGSWVFKRTEQSFGFCFPFVYNNPLEIFTIEKLIFSPVKNLLSTLRQLRACSEYILVKLLSFSEVHMASLSWN